MRIQGIYPPMLTPLTQRGQLDEAAMEALFEHAIEAGVHGLFILGSCGEGNCFSLRQRQQIARAALRINGGRLPLLAGALEPSTESALECIRALAACGVEHFVVTPPYYFGHGQPEIVRHFDAVSRAVSGQLILYNIPQFTGVCLTPDTVRQLAQFGNVCCIKDSNPDWIAVQRMLSEKATLGIDYMLGHEDLAGPGMLLGGDGIVPSLANAYPKLFVRLYDAAVKGDMNGAMMLHRRAIQLRAIVQPHANWIAVIKRMAARYNLCGEAQPLPFRPLSPAQRAQIDAALDAFAVTESE